MWLTSSSIGRKVVMSVSGAALVLFLTFHMLMNLVYVYDVDREQIAVRSGAELLAHLGVERGLAVKTCKRVCLVPSDETLVTVHLLVGVDETSYYALRRAVVPAYHRCPHSEPAV